MTPQNAKQFLPLITALAEGKTIQILTPNGRWLDMDAPSFAEAPTLYRIKPEKKKGWVNIYNGWTAACAYQFSDTKEQADERAASRNRTACIEIEYEEGQGL
jgi:hypothetical protein